jgi:uncharacterized protein (TIGR02466 family)
MINNLFPTPIYYSSIEDDILEKLQSDVTKYIILNEDLFNQNQWKCNTKTNIFCDESRRFFPTYLKDLIIENTSRYMVECKFKSRGFVVDDCWITVGGDGGYQELHDHLGAGSTSNGFSGVMYISSSPDKGGEFVIQSPIDTLAKLLPESDNDLLAPQIHIEPQEGLFVSFPSWVKHGSLQYRDTEKKRISISWNVDFK